MFRNVSPDPNKSDQKRSLGPEPLHLNNVLFYPPYTHTQTFFPVLQNSLAHSGDLVYSPRLWATESWFLLKMHWAAQHDKPIIEQEEEKSLNYQLANLEGKAMCTVHLTISVFITQ